MDIRIVEDGDVGALVALWTECGLTRPWNDPASDIALARRSPGCRLFVGTDGQRLVASVMCGADGHRGWLYYLAVADECRHRGFGRALVRHAEQWLRSVGMPKVELIVREENVAVRDFYERIGYAVEPRLLMARWLNA